MNIDKMRIVTHRMGFKRRYLCGKQAMVAWIFDSGETYAGVTEWMAGTVSKLSIERRCE
ncbi:hypothetical protein [Rhizobium sp. CSW-27]|uniref:hypothetical protein n=1 Tax=Rhizobium sp. CSW-27 TaxID=2839985 RepID=UPI001C00C9A0|nr:hypothetical protein [Rhizobium sp. CSW-27]MBT9371991.1 hypothetical protein [Rhizobium sp. CSW-27]